MSPVPGAKEVVDEAGYVRDEKGEGPAVVPRYRDNAIDAFGRGACFDLRVRFAMELLTHSPIFAGSLATSAGGANVMAPTFLATHALDISTELFSLAERRGLVEPFKELDQDKGLQGHARRQVAFQLFGQKENMKQQAEAGGQVQTVGGAGIPFARRPN
jgi:hypothetical protein